MDALVFPRPLVALFFDTVRFWSMAYVSVWPWGLAFVPMPVSREAVPSVSEGVRLHLADSDGACVIRHVGRRDTWDLGPVIHGAVCDTHGVILGTEIL